MYITEAGEEVFVVDGHTHFWDASVENHRNFHAKQFIDSFFQFHNAMSPKEFIWDRDKFYKYDAETMHDDLFVKGYVDVALMHSTYLTDFYKDGFNTLSRNLYMKERYPDRFIVNGAFDPRDGEAGLDQLRAEAEQFKLKGVKLYTGEWRGSSKGYKLSHDKTYRFLEECEKLGILNIHVHKGPTITPLNMDAFDVRDIDEAASLYPNLRFIVEHCGLPRLDDFCWIAALEPNVYGGLAGPSAFIVQRPGYFAHVMSELLAWLGEDRLIFGSDYGIWVPSWQIEKFMAYELPQDIVEEKKVSLTLESKRKILGLNAAKLYDIDVEAHKRKFAASSTESAGRVAAE